jgi:sigma-E factor negative regulatory protein RseB
MIRPVMRSWQGILAAMLLALPALAAAEQPTAPFKLLQSMNEALRGLNYAGTVVYSHGNQMQTLRVFHRADENGEYERLVSLNGPPREVIRDGKKVTCILPDQNSVVVQKNSGTGGFLQGLPHTPEALEGSYRLAIDGGARLVGRYAKILSVYPEDGLRYGYRFWIDQATSSPLRSAVIDHRGRVLEQIMFTEMKVHDVLPMELLEPQMSAVGLKEYHSGGAVESGVGEQTEWQIRWLPAGFKVSLHQRLKMANAPAPTEHIIISDGVATISVYIDRIVDERPKVGVSHFGMVSSYEMINQAHHITVMGEVPIGTAQLVAQALELRGEAGD